MKPHNRPPGAQLPSTGNDWLTPPDLLHALGALAPAAEGWALSRAPFALDPCASMRQPWPTARTMWTEDADGTARDWSAHAEVWLNPPYGSETYSWLARLADHGSGAALVYARTDTQGFHSHVWGRAAAVYFFKGRMFFHEPVTGYQAPYNCGGPVCLVCYGPRALERAKRLLRPGSPYPGNLVPVTRTAPGKRKAA